MAVAIAQVEADGSAIPHVIGDLRACFIDVTPDASWLAAGEAVALSSFGLTVALFVTVEQKGGYVWRYDRAAEKLLAYYGDNNNAADGPLIAVPDAVDLSALGKIRLMAIGR